MIRHKLKGNHARVKERVQNGVPLTNIAKEFGVKRQAVHAYVYKHFADDIQRGNCLECGKSLDNKRLGAKFCCLKHATKYHYVNDKVKCICIRCGKTKYQNPPTDYCSKVCENGGVKFHVGEIVERYQKGETVRQIAKSLDATPNVLRVMLYKQGVHLTRPTICSCGVEFPGTDVTKRCGQCLGGVK